MPSGPLKGAENLEGSGIKKGQVAKKLDSVLELWVTPVRDVVVES